MLICGFGDFLWTAISTSLTVNAKLIKEIDFASTDGKWNLSTVTVESKRVKGLPLAPTGKPSVALVCRTIQVKIWRWKPQRDEYSHAQGHTWMLAGNSIFEGECVNQHNTAVFYIILLNTLAHDLWTQKLFNSYNEELKMITLIENWTVIYPKVSVHGHSFTSKARASQNHHTLTFNCTMKMVW